MHSTIIVCFIWDVSCTTVVLIHSVMCGCFGNVCTCTYYVLSFVYCDLYYFYVYLISICFFFVQV